MANNDDNVIVWVFVLAALGAAFLAGLFVLSCVVTVGATFGGGVSLHNYFLAFKNNVKLEKSV